MPLRFERHDGQPLAGKWFALPACLPDETAPATAWTVVTDDPLVMRAAIGKGAAGVLVPLDSCLDAAGHMAVALSVAEADLGLGDGDLTLMMLIGGPGAALALAGKSMLSHRLVAIGIDYDALVAASGEAGAATAAGLVALAAATRGIACFVTNSPLLAADRTQWHGFALRLAASSNPPNGKSWPKA